MSIYISKLSNRLGIDWPPVGEWQQGVGVEGLETFARNLDISDAAHTDLLNSVPTPWARLLLFEAALYDPEHPAHDDVVDQWRGLLGLTALHELLRLQFDASRRLDLRRLPGDRRVRDAFMQLRPRHVVDGRDEEESSWHQFSLISVSGSVLGATSPRTLVFTGVSHVCPESIPFRSDEGRLSDPVAYYKRFGDETFLGILTHWLDVLIQEAGASRTLVSLLGSLPSAYGQPASRFALLMQALRDWRTDLADVTPLAQWPLQDDSHFEGAYSILRSLRLDSHSTLLNRSDLFMRDREDTLVFFNRGQHSSLVNRSGVEITADKIRICDGHWTEAGRPLPQPLDFLPPLKLMEDPSAFFEDALIQSPLNTATSYSVEFEGHLYLLPYKQEVLDYFTPEEITRYTFVHRVLPNHVTVELTIPLVNHRMVRATRTYREDTEVLTSDRFPVANLAFWPNFICGGEGTPQWQRYFYYKFDQGAAQLDFKPLGAITTARGLTNRAWFETEEPLTGFVGTVDGRRGLLLIKYERISPPTKDWKVAVDLGSTHTRAFSLEVENQDGRWLGVGGEIRPIRITSRVKELTACQPIDLLQNFFVMEKTVGQGATEEFMSHLVMPQPTNEDYSDWLPREGLIYQQSLLKGFPLNAIRYNFKWNSNTTDYALRAYLRCLLILIQGEALREGARVVSVSHAYPSVFTPALTQKHKNEWAGLGSYAGLAVEPPLMESEAVGRYQQFEQGAAVSSNTIALDVGGSTTDIAIWSSNNLSRQESVKMAAGVAGRYVQTEPGPFKQEFVKLLAGQPFKLTPQLSEFADKDAGFTLMFNAILNSMAAAGKLEQLVHSIRTTPAGTMLIAHIMFVFGALLYYAGMLGRKVNMMGEAQYYVYFCGKGGLLVTWIDNHELFVREMFSAGLLGMDKAPAKPIDVKAALSEKPKQEVGRGLLAESSLSARPGAAHQGGLVNLNPPKVTVGEEGYGNHSWHDDLDGDALISLPQQVPAYDKLRELNNFVRAFVNSVSTRDAALLLKLGAREPAGFRDNLKARLFGTARGRIVYDLRHHPNEALLESLFITEVKVLLETITNNPRLFG